FGDIENLHFEGKLQNFYKDFFGDSPKLINAENGPMFQNRVMDELQVIAQEMVHENLDSAMIVAHAGTIRMTHYTFLEIEQKNYRDLEIDNGTGFSFKVAYDVKNRQFQLLDYAPIDI
ncbi:MAG TPA: histidine phosphatase family protein, partial [Erysipelothrix sp.]|nr:histidine phosphatase family protein [Erysipelothrix sp.]